MSYTFKRRNSKIESSLEYTKRNLIECLDALEETQQAPYMIEFYTDSYYGNLFNKDWNYKVKIYSCLSDCLSIVGSKNIESFVKFQSLNVSIRNVPIEDLSSSVHEHNEKWIPLGYFNPNERAGLCEKGNSKSFFIINLETLLNHSNSKNFSLNINRLADSLDNIACYSQIYCEDGYMDFDKLLLIWMEIGSKLITIDLDAVKKIQHEVDRLLKTEELNGATNRAARNILKKSGLIIKNAREVAAIKSMYILYFTNEMIRSACNVIRVEKSIKTAKSNLDKISEEIDQLPECDRLLLEIMNFDDSEI